MTKLTEAFVMREGPDFTMRAREQVNRRLNRAYAEIDRALQAGQKDRAATAANYAGEELDQMFRDLAQRILGGAK